MDKENMHPDSDSEDFKPLKRKTLNKTDHSKKFKVKKNALNVYLLAEYNLVGQPLCIEEVHSQFCKRKVHNYGFFKWNSLCINTRYVSYLVYGTVPPL